MNDYNQYPDNDYRYYLEHGTKGKTWTWPDHKYLAKTAEGIYIYTKEQLENARKKGYVFVNNAANSVKDVSKGIKGLATATKNGGIKGAISYTKQQRSKARDTKDFVQGLASNDYSQSDSKKVRSDRIKRDKKAEKALKKKKKALQKDYNKTIGIPVVGKAKRKLNAAIASLKVKNIKRNFYKMTGKKSLADIYRDAKAKKNKEKADAAKRRQLNSDYNKYITEKDDRKNKAENTISNIRRKTYRNTGVKMKYWNLGPLWEKKKKLSYYQPNNTGS